MTAISLMEAGDHGNVAFALSHPKSVTYLPPGRDPVVALENQRKGDAVDVSGYTVLRLDLLVQPPENRWGYEEHAALHVNIEQSHDGVTWAPFHSFPARQVPGRERAVLTGFDNYVRASWYFMRPHQPSETYTDAVRFSWALEGDAQPEAA